MADLLTLALSDKTMCLNPFMKAPTPDNMYGGPPSLASIVQKSLHLRGTTYMVNDSTGVVWIRNANDGLWYKMKIWCDCGCGMQQDGIVVRTGRGGVWSRNGFITTKHLADFQNETQSPKVRFN